ncbi:hypothetical protein BJ741DRAFT_605916 [Chytriomyces cf. hyalinus JEL632]|nr:hypothetical protein BJ741DRAFT_605916 [Chytriomyces cf. hyalinus JEL632]
MIQVRISFSLFSSLSLLFSLSLSFSSPSIHPFSITFSVTIPLVPNSYLSTALTLSTNTPFLVHRRHRH